MEILLKKDTWLMKTKEGKFEKAPFKDLGDLG